jgi:hypothetical protein
MRQPRKDRGKPKRDSFSPDVELAFCYGALQSLATLTAIVLPTFQAACKKVDYQAHWQVLKPHCPPIANVPCPPDCQNSRKHLFDGCHVCDCLRGKPRNPPLRRTK